MKYYIVANGITDNKPSKEELPNKKEIDFCKKVLKFISENKGFHHGSTSYGYKHVLEKCFEKSYISNGSFIQAAQDLGMSIKRVDDDSLNAFFKFSDKDLRIALLTYLTAQHETKITSSEMNEIKEQLIQCKTKNCSLTLNDLGELYKNFCNLDIGVKDILKITDEIDKDILKIKYEFKVNPPSIKDENFGSKSTINISLNKLAKLLIARNEDKKNKKMKIN
jgi:hypothetical protein